MLFQQKFQKIIWFCLFAVLTILLFGFLTGCFQEKTLEEQQRLHNKGHANQLVDIISISGVGEEREISNKNPIKIQISGIGNKIRIREDTIVYAVTITGSDNVLYLPQAQDVKLKDEGLKNRIVYG